MKKRGESRNSCQIHMIYTLVRQEHNHYCGPAIAQAILNEHGISLSQDEIALAVGCNEIEGTSVNNLGNFLHEKGFYLEFYDYNAVPLNEPDFMLAENIGKKHIFVLYPNSEKNHFVLVLGFSDPIIKVADPHDLAKKSMNLDALMKRMHEKKTGGFGLVEKLF